MANRIRNATARQREWDWGSRYDPLLIEMWSTVTLVATVFFVVDAFTSEPDWLTLFLVALSVGCLGFVTREALRRRKRRTYRK